MNLLLVLLLDLLLLHLGLGDPVPHEAAIGQSPGQHLPVRGGRLGRGRRVDHNLKLIPGDPAKWNKMYNGGNIKTFKSPTFHPGPCLQS